MSRCPPVKAILRVCAYTGLLRRCQKLLVNRYGLSFSCARFNSAPPVVGCSATRGSQQPRADTRLCAQSLSEPHAFACGGLRLREACVTLRRQISSCSVFAKRNRNCLLSLSFVGSTAHRQPDTHVKRVARCALLPTECVLCLRSDDRCRVFL